MHGNKVGYELFSESKGVSLLSNYKGKKYLIDGVAKGVNKIPNAEYTIAMNKSTIYLDELGNIVGQSYKGTALYGVAKEKIPSDYTYSTKYDIYNKFADDTVMCKRWGKDYDTLSSKEKYQAKELDYMMRVVAGVTEPEEVAAATLNYLKGSGKTLKELNAVDKVLINFCSNKSIVSAKVIEKFNKSLSSIKASGNLAKIAKFAKVNGITASAVIAAITVFDTVNRANFAIENGRPYEAAGIVIGSSSELAITLLGTEALTGALAPYLMGAGTIIAGPVGTVLGAALAGAIGYGVSSFAGSLLDDLIENLWGDLDELFSDATNAVRYVADPLVIDLDGDGFEVLSVKDGVYFDEDAKGLVEKTQWMSADDALLAIDLNKDGIINNGTELFGTSMTLADGTIAQGGFEALAQYDENQDGVIDKNDTVFSKLMVWQDVNSDGVSQIDELFSMQDLGIKAISLDSSEEDGRKVAQVNFENGTSSKIGEFDFDSQLYNTIEKESLEISDEILELPNVKAIGNVASLHTLMYLDETSTLKEYVTQFAKSTSFKEKEELITKILYFVTGANQVAQNSRGDQFDAQKLVVIEKFMGKDFIGTTGINPVNTAATILEGIYSKIYNAYYSILSAQTHLKNYLDMTTWIEDKEGKKYLNTDTFDKFISICIDKGFDMTDIVAEMGRYISSVNFDNKENFNNYFISYVNKEEYAKAIASVYYDNTYIITGENNSYSATSLSDAILGSDKNDSLCGNDGDDCIYGATGNDNLYGGNGNDILIGGEGNDTLYGDNGNDIYVFKKGYGQDIIDNYYNQTTDNDILEMRDLKYSECELVMNGYDLVVKVKGTNDSVTVRNCFVSEHYRINSIKFADKTISYDDIVNYFKTTGITVSGTSNDDNISTNILSWAKATIGGREGNDKINGSDGNETIYAGDGNDVINSGSGNDIIYGQSGNDTINAGAGNDVLIGQEGNDKLIGGAGNDVYVFKKGYGQDIIDNYNYHWDDKSKDNDTLEMKELKQSEVNLNKEGNDLIISIKGTEDKVTIRNHYSSEYYRLNNLKFADGTIICDSSTGDFNLTNAVSMLKQTYCSTSNDELMSSTSTYNIEEQQDVVNLFVK